MTKQPGDKLDAQVRSIADRHRPMNGAERRKVNRVLARAVALELLKAGDQKLTQLSVHLVPTNRVLERHAVGSGSGLPGDVWDDSRKSCVDPLPDRVHTVVDQLIIKAAYRYRDFEQRWYCGTGSVVSIMRDLGLSRSGVYLEWHCMLEYFKYQFERSENRDLRSLMTRID
jgi:hypothetical protein